jgi:hypothetical protein
MDVKNLAKALAVAAAPVAALGAMSAALDGAQKLYSEKVWATQAEQDATFPGDDLVADPNGCPVTAVFQARDLDAPLDEVWKLVYQMDVEKAGYYSWVNFERLFGMNVNNYYGVQEMWQGPDEKRPGDFWSWGLAGWGFEVADLVPGKYVTWFTDSRNPTQTPGASNILAPGMDYLIAEWTIALSPLDGGARCRCYSKYVLAWGPHNPYTDFLMKKVIGQGGAIMGRRMLENLEKTARHERGMTAYNRASRALLGGSYSGPKALRDRVAFPEVRWSRDFPEVEVLRAPITDDPNWPPREGEEYRPPIAENNERAGWTPRTHEEKKLIASQRRDELMREMGLL